MPEIADVPTLGVTETAVRLKCGELWVRRLIRKGKLRTVPGLWSNSPLRITVESINEFEAEKAASNPALVTVPPKNKDAAAGKD